VSEKMQILDLNLLLLEKSVNSVDKLFHSTQKSVLYAQVNRNISNIVAFQWGTNFSLKLVLFDNLKFWYFKKVEFFKKKRFFKPQASGFQPGMFIPFTWQC